MEAFLHLWLSISFLGGLVHYFYIRPHMAAIISRAPIVLSGCAGVLTVLLVIMVMIRYEREAVEAAVREERPTLERELGVRIGGFKPLRHYDYEEAYHLELAGYLKSFYPDLDIEVTRNYSRPDIVIGHMAIEIKGPT